MENNKDSKMSRSLVADYGSSDCESNPESEYSNNSYSMSEETFEISDMVLKNNIINACAHGPLKNTTGKDNARHILIDEQEAGVIEYEVTEYREVDSDDESETSSDVQSVKDVEEESSSSEDEDTEILAREGKRAPLKVCGELDLDDLPPIEDLSISVPEEQCTIIGKVHNVIDRLVIVQALPGIPAVDLDSVLFLEKGARTLGKVFDVFGPVTDPLYVVRFNSLDHIKEHGVEKGMDVYIAPQTDHTSYVFVSELMKIKGSDASWRNDIEVPPSEREFSDDDEEKRAKNRENQSNHNRGEPSRARSKAKPKRNNQRSFGGPSNHRAANQQNFNPRNPNNPFSRFRRPPFNHQQVPPFMQPNYIDSPIRCPPGFPPRAQFIPQLNALPPHAPNIPPFPPNMHQAPPPRGFQYVNQPGRLNMQFVRPNMPIFGARFSAQHWYNGAPPPPGT